MVLPDEALACAVTRYHFKPIVGEVVRLLLTNPGSTLSRISFLLSPFCEKQLGRKNLNHSPIGDSERLNLVRDSLTVLIQHGIAYSRELPKSVLRKPSSKDETTASTKNHTPSLSQVMYFVNIDDLLFRTRLPLFLGCARRSYGDVGEAAVRAIFERGRLSASHIFETALNPVLADLDITVDDAEACLCDMAKSGLLHWCGTRSFSHSTEVIMNDATTHTNSATPADNRNGRKRHYRTDLLDEGFRGNKENHNGISPVIERITVGRGEHSREVGAPKKDNDVDIWGICFWHLNREFRIECCALMVQQRVNSELPVRVLRAGLQLALQGEDCEQPSEDFETADISTDSIQKQLEEQHGVVNVQEFWAATKTLVEQSPPFVVAIPEQAPTCLRFIPGRLISETRQKTLEDLVMNRYGRVGHRIFRALMIEGGMEEKMIAEKCLLPLKVVREHLLNMYQDRIILTQEVPRSNDQQRASNWYYLWLVNPLSAYRGMLEVMYKTATKLFVRLEQLDAQNAVGEHRKALQMHESLLTASILRMDQSIMVMRDFGAMTANYLPARYRVMDGQIGKAKRGR